MVDITGLDKASVIQALYAAAAPVEVSGLGYEIPILPYGHATLMVGRFVDKPHGRILKVRIGDDNEFNPKDYDAANGTGAAEKAVAGVRSAKTFPSFWATTPA